MTGTGILARFAILAVVVAGVFVALFGLLELDTDDRYLLPLLVTGLAIVVVAGRAIAAERAA